MNIFKKYPPFKFILAILDLIVLNCSFAIALRLRFMPHIDVINLSEFTIAKEWSVFAIYSFVWIFVFHYLALYKRHIIFTKSKQEVLIIKGILWGFLGLLIIQFIIRPFSVILDSRLMLAYFLLFSVFFMSIYRLFFIRIIFRSRWLENILNEKAFIIGAGRKGKLLASKIHEEKEYQSQVIGFLDDNIEKGKHVFEAFSVIGAVSDIENVLREYQINAIYLAIDNISKNKLYQIISVCLKSKSYIYISSDLLDILPEKINLEKVKDLPVVRAISNLDGIYTNYVKSLIDVVVTSIGILIISPLLLIISVGVKLSSPGPVIFTQKRLGRNGKLFNFYKFRSMIVGSDCDESRKEEMVNLIKGKNNNCNTCLRASLIEDPSTAPAGQVGARSQSSHRQNGSTKVVNSSRVTRFGKFMRKYSLDELPQLFNVIKGDMSLVGPRPCLPYEFEVYDEWHKRRLDVKPGCTGLWQVTSRSETTYDDMVVLDIYYIQNISPWFDLQLLLKTIPVLLTGKGGE